jgi:YggT family protein
MQAILVWVIQTTVQVITFLVIVKVVLSYFMSPYHPVRETIERLVEPLLAPIRRVLPPMGMLDFSPFVLIILLQLVRGVLIRLVISLF